MNQRFAELLRRVPEVINQAEQATELVIHTIRAARQVTEAVPVLKNLFGPSFEQGVREAADHLGLPLVHLESRKAHLRCEGYHLTIQRHDTGELSAGVWTKSTWRGRAPAAAHVLAERMDRQCKNVSFRVDECSDGKIHLYAMCIVRSLDVFSTSEFRDIAVHMLGSMKAADELLVENGFA